MSLLQVNFSTFADRYVLKAKREPSQVDKKVKRNNDIPKEL